MVDHYHGVAGCGSLALAGRPEFARDPQLGGGTEPADERYLARLPARARFARRLRALLDYERRGVPERENGVYVYAWNPGQAEQDVLRVTRDLSQPGRVLVDPRLLRADGTVAVADFALSPDGRSLAYAELADGGSDWKTWRIRDVATGI